MSQRPSTDCGSPNVFVPNLVWLPSQVAKLSDREDEPFQTALKEISWNIFRDVPLNAGAEDVARRSWALLPTPRPIRPLVESEINWFVSTPRFIKTRKSKLASVIHALEQIGRGQAVPQTLQPSRYRDGIANISASNRERLHADLTLHDRGFVVEVDRSHR